MVGMRTYIIDRGANRGFEPSAASQEYMREQTMCVMHMVKRYFLSAYREGNPWNRVQRTIKGVVYVVERANHGLGHGLRQGALAKDIFDLLLNYPIADSTGLVEWAKRKEAQDLTWVEKIEMASSFQRSGRESECSSARSPKAYKRYELQDMLNFREHAKDCSLFTNDDERKIFEEAILWSNPGTLDPNEIEDLKYLRRILHAAHSMDLRRMPYFDGYRVQKDALDQLFEGAIPKEAAELKMLLWYRSGEYLRATGDRDLVTGRYYQDHFFTQSRNPSELVNAIHDVSKISLYTIKLSFAPSNSLQYLWNYVINLTNNQRFSSFAVSS
jgi:hypothetical protein